MVDPISLPKDITGSESRLPILHNLVVGRIPPGPFVDDSEIQRTSKRTELGAFGRSIAIAIAPLPIGAGKMAGMARSVSAAYPDVQRRSFYPPIFAAVTRMCPGSSQKNGSIRFVTVSEPWTREIRSFAVCPVLLKASLETPGPPLTFSTRSIFASLAESVPAFIDRLLRMKELDVILEEYTSADTGSVHGATFVAVDNKGTFHWCIPDPSYSSNSPFNHCT